MPRTGEKIDIISLFPVFTAISNAVISNTKYKCHLNIIFIEFYLKKLICNKIKMSKKI